MNFLILNWLDPKNPISGGAEKVTEIYAEGLIDAGHNVTWFTSSFKDAKREEELNGIKILRRGGRYSVHFFAPLYYLINGKNFDLIVDEIHGSGFLTPLYVRKPKIAFIHEVAGEISNFMFPFPLNKLFRLFEPLVFLIHKNSQFLTVSQSTKKELEKMGIKRIKIIRNGIDIVTNKHEKEKTPTFIFLSRIVKMKGIEEVFKTFSLIYKKEPSAVLWVVGGGEKRYLEKLSKMLINLRIEKKIKFFGKVSESRKYELLKRANILLHASVKEGWGLVVMEAASQGTPSVVYNVAGLRDSVLNNKTGIVLSENTPAKMADEALGLIHNKNKYEKFSSQSLKWARENSWKKSLIELVKFVEEVGRR